MGSSGTATPREVLKITRGEFGHRGIWRQYPCIVIEFTTGTGTADQGVWKRKPSQHFLVVGSKYVPVSHLTVNKHHLCTNH